MKKAFVITLLMALVSCQETDSTFNGLGELSIGQKFTSLPISKEFTKVMDDEYNIRRFELSSEIGSVSDLNVTTDNGKISEVKFTNNEDTNIAAIEEVIKGMKEPKIEKHNYIGYDESKTAINLYTTADEKITFVVVINKDRLLKNGKPLCEFSYIDKAAVIKNHNQTMKSMGLKDSKQVEVTKTAP